MAESVNVDEPWKNFTPAQALIATVFLSLSNLVVVLDLTVANVSVPHIAGTLGAAVSQGTWVITSYAVSEACAVPLTGWVSRRFGAWRMYLLCMMGFAAFSVVCGASISLSMLIAARIGQGLCGGLLMPLVQTLLLRVNSPEKHTRAMLIFTMTILLGPAIGPNVGGYISDNWSWHWIFFINMPIAATCLIVNWTLVKPAETKTEYVPIDKVGLGLLVLWVGSLQLMLDLGREHDWFADPMIVALAAIAAVGFAAFVIWEMTEKNPIVDVSIFRHRGFTFAIAALSLCFGTYFASIVMIPQWLQSSKGYSATLAGFVTATTAFAALMTSRFSAKLLEKLDPRLMVSMGVGWLGVNAILRSGWTSDADLFHIILPQFLQGFGIAFFMLPLTTISLGSVAPNEVPNASGLQNFARTLSIGIGTAVAFSLWDNTQQTAHTELAANLQPDQTLSTLESLGMSLDQARIYIESMVQREAVTIALDHVFLLSAVAFFCSAAVVWLVPKPKRREIPKDVH